jgi:hypothetical protein
VIYLLGNKKDLSDNRVIDLKRGTIKATSQKMNRFVEVSAKTKENLMETFKEFYMEIYYRNKKKIVEKRKRNLKTYEILKKQDNNNNCC